MSILHTLKKFIDPMTYTTEEGERYTLRNLPSREDDGGPPPPTVDKFRCRVCGRTAPERGFCPDCLADTMVPIEE